MKKSCFTCKIVKDFSDFTSGNDSNGLASSCKSCVKIKSKKRYQENRQKMLDTAKEWKKNNKEKAKEHKRKSYLKNIKTSKNYNLQYNFGIDLSTYTILLNKQNGVCAICHEPETVNTNTGKLKSLAVDHDHKTGQIRGLLCMKCNVQVGVVENEDRLKTLLNYLQSNSGLSS